ncbi:MAG: hypothetical protein HGA25_09110, partial [Clostridiales bacterium]|nr:hypothetical protein [Clostridiales bacterium]
MEHKAFLFDYDAFERELAPILTKALDNENPAPILSFIEQNIDVLTDPYNGDS